MERARDKAPHPVALAHDEWPRGNWAGTIEPGPEMDGRRRRCLVPALLPGTSEVGGGMLWIAHLTLAATPLSTFPALEWGPSSCRPNTEHRTMSPRTSRVTSTSSYLRRLGAVSIPKRKGEPLRANCSLALGFSDTPQPRSTVSLPVHLALRPTARCRVLCEDALRIAWGRPRHSRVRGF